MFLSLLERGSIEFYTILGSHVLIGNFKRSCNTPQMCGYWLDILMLAFLPLFAGFKIAKIAVKAVKGAKLTKSGVKAYLGAKKLQKARSVKK